ncbi:N-acetylneuraminate 9-O-acetyltransferase [Camelus dromedarius]|uniref:N-acetylneuraminate (7)9-O-acetyltransferase n=1 Tax=Camelus dromedarius TaxID=9838 RepID=A0A5N4DYF0_CAMDR|nr:N-acetylneuraminate 9-O-acetyltransferase [Camelus dromedarius]
MAALAYNLGKREINHYFSVRSAKAMIHVNTFSRVADFLERNEAKNCLVDKHIAFIGDSRIRQLFYSFVKIINPQFKEEGNKHENIPFEDKIASVKVDFLWHPEVNGSMKQCIKVWTEDSVAKPHVIVAGAATWSIKIHNGSNEALSQYKMNITSIAPLLEKLAKTSDVYWVLQDPVYEDLLSENRKMITNEKIDAYNEAAVSILNSSTRNSKSNVKMFSVSKLIAQETIMESLDGLHLPESSRETSAMILMNVYCNKILKPVDGSCCQPRPPLTLIQKLAACFFTLSIIGYLIFYIIHRNAHRKNKPCTDLESGEEKKNIINPPVSPLEILLQSFCKLGLIMAYFYMCDRANLFMKENKFYTHSTFFIPIIYILVLGVFYNENTKETKVLNREQTDEWKGWMQLVILIYHISGASTVVFHGMLFAFIYLALQKRQILSEGKGEPLFSNKVSNFLLFISVVSFLTYSIWASSCKNKAECNELHPSVSVVQVII